MHVWHDFPRHISPFTKVLNIWEKSKRLRERETIHFICVLCMHLFYEQMTRAKQKNRTAVPRLWLHLFSDQYIPLAHTHCTVRHLNKFPFTVTYLPRSNILSNVCEKKNQKGAILCTKLSITAVTQTLYLLKRLKYCDIHFV